jgi:hypothetical protein
MGVDPGARAPIIQEPLHPLHDIPAPVQVNDTNGVQAVPGSGAHWSVPIPAHVGLQNLSDILIPGMLHTQLDHCHEIACQAWRCKDGILAAVDRPGQDGVPFLGQRVVYLADVAVGAFAAPLEEGVGPQRDTVPDIELLGDVQLRQDTRKRSILRVEELIERCSG